MDLETANKLNDALKPFGYTVGRIQQEINAYGTAIKFCNIEGKFDEAKAIEKEKDEIEYSGMKDVPRWKHFDHHDILTRHGVKS